jgi:hypothetical protein
MQLVQYAVYPDHIKGFSCIHKLKMNVRSFALAWYSLTVSARIRVAFLADMSVQWNSFVKLMLEAMHMTTL